MEYTLRIKSKKDLNTLLSFAKEKGISIKAESQGAAKIRKDLQEFVEDLKAEKQGEKRFLSSEEFWKAMDEDE
jgi:hypothetical protein